MNFCVKAGTKRKVIGTQTPCMFARGKSPLINKNPPHMHLNTIWDSFKGHKRKMLLESCLKTLQAYSFFRVCMLSATWLQRLSSSNRCSLYRLHYHHFISAPDQTDKSETEEWEATCDLWLGPWASIVIKRLIHSSLGPRRKHVTDWRDVTSRLTPSQIFPSLTVKNFICSKWHQVFLK